MSKVRQLSVFIANTTGRVSKVTELLGDAGVNIRGFSVSDTEDFGILRLVDDKPDEAVRVLQGYRSEEFPEGFRVHENDVICLKLPDVPGALAGALKTVADAGVNIEYVYSLVSTYVVLNVSDADRAIELLSDRPVKLVSQEEISQV